MVLVNACAYGVNYLYTRRCGFITSICLFPQSLGTIVISKHIVNRFTLARAHRHIRTLTHLLPPPQGAVAVAAGLGHSCALLTGGRVDCWGSNSNGQLGTGDTNNRLTPTGVTGLGLGGQVLEIISNHYLL